MAKIDKFLATMVGRGAPLLRLDPGDVPVLELPGGHRTPLSGQELLGTVLDGLAKEVLPPEQETAYLRGDKIQFDYVADGERFQILLARSNLGTRIVVGRVAGGSGKAGSAAGGGSLKSAKLDVLVQRMLSSSASDLYLNTDEFPVLRKDGKLEIQDDITPLGSRDMEDLIKPWVPAKNMEAYVAGHDTEFSHLETSLPCRLRVSLFHDATGPSIALRIVPKEVPDASTLGLSEAVRRLASLNKGLVLLTGPMGSGKSTTLACLLELINQTRKDFIIGVYDAVEFELGKGGCLARQREIGRDPKRQRQALRSALRQAPDILVIDEIRDPEAIDLALQAAHAGHVVFATLQTASIVDTLSCMVDSFPMERQPWIRTRLAGCLKAIVGHTLLRRTSGGRAAALETLFTTPAIAELIRDDKHSLVPAAMKGGRYGQETHNDALVSLIQRGIVDPMEAYLRCQERDTFIAACKKAGIDFDPRGEGAITTDV
jgi:twitching motility protein PilT